jgi:methyl-accepting chemotaxis protein
MMLNQWKIGPKVYLVVGLLALVAAAIGGLGVDAMHTYNEKVRLIDRASNREILGERVNGLIYAVVMDSRGIYMSDTLPESEKYAPPLIRNLDQIEDLMKRWSALIEPQDAATMERANARVDEFIRFRSELVRLSRQATHAEARSYGDNDANRTNRAALNNEIATLAASNGARIESLNNEIATFYRDRVRLLAAVAVGGVLLSVILAVLFVRRFITVPVTSITQAMRRLAGGDTSGAVPATESRTRSGKWRAQSNISKPRRWPRTS